MPVATQKRCNGCGETKPLADFYRLKSAADGRQKRCKGCQSGTPAQRDRMQRHRRRNPGLHRQRRRAERLARYGLSAEDFDRMLVGQAGRCGGCGDPLLSPAVDHDHATGAVRGLLCTGCNTALGSLRDDPVRILRLLAYLEGQ